MYGVYFFGMSHALMRRIESFFLVCLCSLQMGYNYVFFCFCQINDPSVLGCRICVQGFDIAFVSVQLYTSFFFACMQAKFLRVILISFLHIYSQYILESTLFGRRLLVQIRFVTIEEYSYFPKFCVLVIATLR